VKAFTAAVLGGIGSLPGAVIGGLLIGLIEVMWSAYFTIDYKDVAAFCILAIVLSSCPPASSAVPKSRRSEPWRRPTSTPAREARPEGRAQGSRLRRPRHLRPLHPHHRLGHPPEHGQCPGARPALGGGGLGGRHRLRRPLPDALRQQGKADRKSLVRFLPHGTFAFFQRNSRIFSLFGLGFLVTFPIIAINLRAGAAR
jgi:hypothetical protein